MMKRKIKTTCISAPEFWWGPLTLLVLIAAHAFVAFGFLYPGLAANEEFASGFWVDSLFKFLAPYLPRVQGMCTALTVFCFVSIMTTDPGYLPESVKGDPEDEEDGNVVLISKQSSRPKDKVPTKILPSGRRVRLQYCNHCELYRAPHTKHCSWCERCVEYLDHHCDKTGTCIAKNSNRWFVGILGFAGVALLCNTLALLARLRQMGAFSSSAIWKASWEPYIWTVFALVMVGPAIGMPYFPLSFVCINGVLISPESRYMGVVYDDIFLGRQKPKVQSAVVACRTTLFYFCQPFKFRNPFASGQWRWTDGRPYDAE